MTLSPDLAALGGLAPVSLDEIMAAADLQTRRDRKYLVPSPLVAELLADVGPGARVLTIDGSRLFRYESVYFDTVDLVSYLGAARRRPRRFKVRTRSYLDSGTCMLEVKVRDGRNRNVKHRTPYDVERRAELGDAGREFVAGFEQPAAFADRLQPTLVTSYDRATLALADSRARVTVDVDVAWSDGARTAAMALRRLALVETKTAGQPCAVDRALWRLGFRPVTISKYCTGLAALTPELPANKWNRVLRRHFDWTPARVGAHHCLPSHVTAEPATLPEGA